MAPIRDSMRSRRLWRSRWTMKSSSERTRKDDTQLTTRRIPLAMESSRLPPSAGGRAALRGPAPRPPAPPAHLTGLSRTVVATGPRREECPRAGG